MPVDPGKDRPLNLNIDPEWLLRMAEKEGNGIFSVGGLVSRLDPTGVAFNGVPIRGVRSVEYRRGPTPEDDQTLYNDAPAPCDLPPVEMTLEWPCPCGQILTADTDVVVDETGVEHLECDLSDARLRDPGAAETGGCDRV